MPFSPKTNILLSLCLYLFSFSTLWFFNRTGLPMWLLTHHLNIPSTTLRWQVLACVPAHRVSYPQRPSVHILSTISLGFQGSSCPWEKKILRNILSAVLFSVFQTGLQGSCRKQNKTKGHPCHHPRRLKPEDLACGLVGKKSVWSLDSLYRFLCCFLAGVTSGWQSEELKSLGRALRMDGLLKRSSHNPLAAKMGRNHPHRHCLLSLMARKRFPQCSSTWECLDFFRVGTGLYDCLFS